MPSRSPRERNDGARSTNPLTAHSSTAPLKIAWLREPGSYTEAQYHAAGWHKGDNQSIKMEFNQYRDLLRSHDIEVHCLPPSPDNPDAIYLYDTFLSTQHGLILYQSVKSNRQNEPALLKQNLATLGIKPYAEIKPPGYVDGGDLFWMNANILAMGLSWRSNLAAAAQLRTILEPLGIELRCYDLPNLNGAKECLHLMSLISPLDPSCAIVSLPYLPARLLQDLQSLGYTLIESPLSEFDSLGTNVLSLGDRKVIAVEGNPISADRMRKEGFTVISISAPNLCLAGTGGPTCLTGSIFRKR